MKTAFISRMGGIGDVLHAAHLPMLIKKHFGVDHITFESNYQGFHVLLNNPYIDDLQFVDVTKLTDSRMTKHLEYQEEKCDMVFNLCNSIEKMYCTNENDQRYYRGQKWRRENLGSKSYYDVMVDFAGLPKSCYGIRPQLYYPQDEHVKAKDWVSKAKKKHDSDFVIIINLSGSTLHKKFVQAESVCEKVLEAIPSAMIYLTGDECCKDQEFKSDRVKSMVGDWNFRTVGLQCKYVDLTISFESGLALVAHSWDAPTLHLLTAASPDNHTKYAKNARWLQADVACSPCHRNPREYFGCPIKEEHPACVFFDEEKILKEIKESYECSKVLASC
jgi:ADP-heptose:LPS heptosyltransferase